MSFSLDKRVELELREMPGNNVSFPAQVNVVFYEAVVVDFRRAMLDLCVCTQETYGYFLYLLFIR